ncbi:MAG: rRNA adenine N(6)-methyltransferase family protein [Actinomycetota bacterium]|nr:rRNA adenine N(6)-methyltransferase family protein [Actinomycetota bacterium]
MAARRSSRGARRRSYSQNFLASTALAEQLVRDAKVGRRDLVVEIGAGSGILTAALARRAGTVRAIELDPVWAGRLRERFAASEKVTVIGGDARRVPLPDEPFRVVANLPFGATTALLHRLLDDPSTPLRRADLVLQWEVARKRAGRPRTALSASWSPWWRFRLGRRLPRTAFHPPPAVDAGVLVIERQREPLLPIEAREPFRDFVHGVFAGTLAPDLDARQWSALFAAYAADPRGRERDERLRKRRGA